MGVSIDDRRLFGLLPSLAVAFNCRFQLKRYPKNSGSRISSLRFHPQSGEESYAFSRR